MKASPFLRENFIILPKFVLIIVQFSSQPYTCNLLRSPITVPEIKLLLN